MVDLQGEIRGMDMDKPNSLVDQAYNDIKDKICDFRLFPGQVISDFILSKELGMSRTPIRQALQRLERDGLIVDAGAGKSYEVSQITEEEIIELFDARQGIEVMAVKLAVDNGISETQIIEMERMNRNMEAANKDGRIKDNFQYDQEFHDYLVSMSGNKKLIRFHDSLLIQLRRMRMLSYLERTYQDKAYRDHQMIIKGLQGSDKKMAQQALEEHIITSKNDYLRLLNDKIAMEGFAVLRFLGSQ